MNYTIEELNPLPPILVIDKKEIVLSLITLKTELIFMQKYGALSNIFDAIEKDSKELLNVIWILVHDKTQFKKDLEVFKKFALTSRTSIVRWSQDMYSCIHEIINSSMPLIKNKKRYKEIQEIKDISSDKAPCYATYYDIVAKRYGHTLDQFYDLTLRQLHMLLNTIGDKQYEELEVQAALQGRKLKPRMEFADVTPEEERDQEQQALDALKRLQDEYKKKNKGK